MTSREKRELMELLNATCNKIEKSKLCDGLCHNCTIFKAVSLTVNSDELVNLLNPN